MNAIDDIKKIRIGDILVNRGILTTDQLQLALNEHHKTGIRLGKTLIRLGYVDEFHLLSILSEQLDIPFIQLDSFGVSSVIVRSLKETIARRYRVLLLEESDDAITLGMSDPTDIFCLDDIANIFNKKVNPVIVRESELLDILDDSYGETGKIVSLAEELSDEIGEDSVDVNRITQDAVDTDAPVARLIQKIFEEAIRTSASDIHIEPDETVLRIRLRIDGVLSEQVMDKKRISAALVVRLKLMAHLDISEKRLPQDGRFNVRVNLKNIDVRLSTMPVQHGESVVLRLLVLDDGVRNLDEIGIKPDLKVALRKMIHQPYGLVLVTGPTGSGKTTTLYAALSELNTSDRKIITVEDPVEYRLPRLNQVQLKEKIGLDFNAILRASLRQDPDVLLVGEIRDTVSAEITLRAAMTGHLVLSTLHANNAISSVLRLIDIGVDNFLVASALRAVVAQRLVRRLCNKCKLPASNIAEYVDLIDDQYRAMSFYQAGGCSQCFNSGYLGRIGVFEYLEITEDMASALRVKDISLFTSLALQSTSYQSLSTSALALALAGDTSLEEIQRSSLLLDMNN
jgi:MSHA biogenesis protein MshE